MKIKPISSAELVMLRKSTGLNQAEFWGRVGVTQSGGSRYESGRCMPRPVRMLVEIAYAEEGDLLGKELRDFSMRENTVVEASLSS